MTPSPPLTRRQFAKGVGTVGIGAAVAGCVAGSDPEAVPGRPEYGADASRLEPVLKFIVLSNHYQNSWFEHGDDGLPDRPAFEGNVDELNRELRFIIESAEYQNASIAAEAD